MFRLCRKTVFPRWHTKRQNPIDKNQSNSCPKAFVLCTYSEGQSHNESNQKERNQHADRQDRRFWDNPQFYCSFLNSTFFETAGWLGTVALCVNYHLKHINSVLEYGRSDSSCLFSNIVFALPKRSLQQQKYPTNNAENNTVPYIVQDSDKNKIPSEIVKLENIRRLTDQYAALAANVTGVLNISKNEKKAFRSFQNASRFGSSQAFYNLGLCYQLGKGTKVNLNMAGYYYRKAAMKGHGLASFNLAVFFFKGLGGLPVDTKLAKELLAQAAERGVPEAQVYIGLEYLENEKWTEAVSIFSSLAEKQIPLGQYYLGLCYENGFGLKRNEKVAAELYSKSAAQGCAKALKKQEEYDRKKEKGDTDLKSPAILKRNGLHVSSSVPELSSMVKKSDHCESKRVPILSHLDLVSPFLVMKDKSTYKNLIDYDKIAKEYPSTYFPINHISLVALEIKT